jgi:acid phosphatase
VLSLLAAVAVATVTPRRRLGSAAASCGSRAHQRPAVRHVIVVLMENHSYSEIIGHAPYITALARRCGLATNYHAISHPGHPNYLALTSGSTHGQTSDCTPSECPIAARASSRR